MVDKAIAEKILTHIIGNAVRFTNKGYVKISVVASGKKRVLVKVKDTGRGIKKEDRKNLFKQFRQVTGKLYQHGSSEGLGLGLYISKVLARKMDADVKLVRSIPNGGSEFEIELPKRIS